MNPENEKRAKKLMSRMRQDMSRLFKKYHAEAEELSTGHNNPNTPVLGCLQIALCNAAAKYLMDNGVSGDETFHTIVHTLSDGQHHWARAIMSNQTVPEKPLVN